MNFRGVACFVLPAMWLAGVCAVWGQGAQASASAAKSCAIDQRKPSDADKALQQKKYADAERLYGDALTADPASGEAVAGLVRTLLAEDKLPEALALALKNESAHPNDPDVLDALGEVRFRRGEVNDAAAAFNRANRADPCKGMTHYDMWRYLNFSGMHASAQRQLDGAHTLAPLNKEIDKRWKASHAVPQSAQEHLASLKILLTDPKLTDEQKEGMQAAIKGIESSERGDCQVVSQVNEVKVPMMPIAHGGAATNQQNVYAMGLDIELNGKRKRLEIDTGAGGLLLTRSGAKSAGLIPEANVVEVGAGDQGGTAAYLTHVDDIKIGGLEFKNCMVQVLKQSEVLENEDGLIGMDVFRNYLVTLDIPGRELRLGPLPKRPDEAAQTAALDTSSATEQMGPATVADRAQDRYIAPEMKDWLPVFRSSHFLIVPTVIGDAPTKLFVMDTGSSFSMITPAAAREVTHVAGEDDLRVQGLSGGVKKAMLAEHVTMTFAGVRQITNGMASFDSGALDRLSGVEISGAIGFPTLRELVISIDYRDNLVHVVYDPSKGFHFRP